MDISLAWDADERVFDLALAGNPPDLVGDAGLLSAVIVSLFTDARAYPDDPLPDEKVGVHSDLRGFWGDELHDPASQWQAPRSIGSRLWLLWREKDLDVVVARARQYASEALAWLQAEGWVKRLEVDALRVQKGYLGIDVALLPAGSSGPGVNWRFLYDYSKAQLISF